MLKLKTFIIIIVIYIMAYISLSFDINLLYPYYLIKDIIIYPVIATNDNKPIELEDDVKETMIKELQSDIEEMKKLINIKTVLSDFSFINATVIERNRNYWFNSITIDKGSHDDITMDMAVINQDGLIGRINKVNKYTSEIKLITTNDINSKTSVVIENNNQKIYGIMNGYDNEYLSVTLTTKNIDIKEGLLVKTTGMGGIFPSGILIGKVKGSKNDQYDVGTIVLIEPAVNIKDLKYVSVLKRN